MTSKVFAQEGDDESSLSHAAGAATNKTALFHFQRLLIEINAHSNTLFDPEGNFIQTSDWAPYFVHELVHYVQSVSTVLGQRTLLNWFAVQIGAAQKLLGISPLPVPLSHTESIKNANVRAASNELRDYFAEANALISTNHPLRPDYEAKRFHEFELYDYDWRHPRDHSALKGVAISMRSAQDEPFGVPILGDVLTEGMAQVAQYLCAGADIYARLDSTPPMRNGRIYYSALCRFLRATFPQWDARLLTLVISDVALCTRRPGSATAELVQEIRRHTPPRESAGYMTLRRELDGLTIARTGREFILQEIELSDRGIPAGHPLGTLFRRLLQVFRDAWMARHNDPAIFIDTAYDPKFINRIIDTLGAPPVYFEDRDHLIRVHTDEQLERACHAMRGSYDVLMSIYDTHASRECTLLRSRACKHRKTVACRENILDVPTDKDDRACVMAFSANELGLYKRPLRRQV